MMTKAQIEGIRKLAESHNFGGVPIPQLCDLAILGSLVRDMWYADYFQPSAEMHWRTREAVDKAKHEWINAALKEDRDEVLARGKRFAGMAP